MREIKFRAWDTKRKKMFPVSGLAFDNRTEKLVLVSSWEKDAPHNHFAENIIVLQFTGLKDSKGIEIYEGDICRFKNQYMEKVSEVKWRHESAGWNIDDRYLGDTEVIGNLYAYPELLK